MTNRHFIIAGAQRCGTTYLARLLAQHPEVLFAEPMFPEPKFFLNPDAVSLGKKEYCRKYFKETAGAKILGEKSVSYLEVPGAARRIHTCLPEVKIIIMLRDPAIRAVSNYFFTRKHGLEDRSLEEVFSAMRDKEPSGEALTCSVSPFSYLRRGLYERDLDVYWKIFGEQNIRILILENFIQSTKDWESLCGFLRIDSAFVPRDFFKMENESMRRHAEYSESIDKKIRAYYREANEKLAQKYNLDIKLWAKE